MFDLKCKTEIHNYFEIEVIRSGKLRQKAYAQNVVTDTFFSLIGNWSAVQLELAVGDGEGEPSRTDKSLFHEVKSLRTTDSELYWHEPDENIIALKKFFVIKPEELVGKDLKEIGLGYYQGLLTHAMIKDSEGNDLTIHKTEFDEITITAVIYYTVTLPTGVHFYTKRRVLNENFIKGELGAIVTERYEVKDVTVEKKEKKRKSSVRYGTQKNNGESRAVFTSSFYFAPKELENFLGSKIIEKKIGIGDGVEKEYELGTTAAKNIKIYKNGSIVPEENYSIIKKPILVQDYRVNILLRYGSGNYDQRYIKYKAIGDGLLFLVSSRNLNTYGKYNCFSIVKRDDDNYKLTDIFSIEEKYINMDAIKIFENKKGFTFNDLYYNINGEKIEKTTKEKCLGAGELLSLDSGYEDDFIKCNSNDIKAKREKQIISFATPPEDESIITADFECDYIYKDTDYVLDIEIEFDYSAGVGS